MTHKGIVRLITLLIGLFCMYNTVQQHDIIDCGKITGKSTDEIIIKHGTKTKLYLLVEFETIGFKAQEVDPTTYFKYKVNEGVCFSVPDGKNHNEGMWLLFGIIFLLIWTIWISCYITDSMYE